MSDKNNEKLTEQQKKNRRGYKPERQPWNMVCPSCKVFHNPRTPCEAIAAEIAEQKRRGKL
jgi:hypothetical protein